MPACYINELPRNENRYVLLHPIPVHFEDCEGGVIAHFNEAELAIGGSDRDDALDSLVLWVLDSYDSVSAEDHRNLGETPALQLRVLNNYVGRQPKETGHVEVR